MSNPVIATTTQRRTIVGTLDEAFTIASTQAVRDVDAWAGCTISISPVMRDHTTGQFQWEVYVSGNPSTVGANKMSPHPPATPG